MIGYSERKVFTSAAFQAWRLATHLVNSLPYDMLGGGEIRCHELARAVGRFLDKEGQLVRVQDGHLWAIEHTWLVLGHEYGPILDVYAPGRIPMVQLLDAHFCVARGYRSQTGWRDDIRANTVEKLYEDMKPALKTFRGIP